MVPLVPFWQFAFLFSVRERGNLSGALLIYLAYGEVKDILLYALLVLLQKWNH